MVLAAGFGVLASTITAFVRRLMRTDNVPADHARWVEQVRLVLVGLIDVDIDKSNLQARLAHLMGHQPPEYDELAQQSFARTLLVNPAIAAKAEQLGMFAPGTFAQMGVQPYQQFDPTKEPPIMLAAPVWAPRPLPPPAAAVRRGAQYIGAVATVEDDGAPTTR